MRGFRGVANFFAGEPVLLGEADRPLPLPRLGVVVASGGDRSAACADRLNLGGGEIDFLGSPVPLEIGLGERSACIQIPILYSSAS